MRLFHSLRHITEAGNALFSAYIRHLSESTSTKSMTSLTLRPASLRALLLYTYSAIGEEKETTASIEDASMRLSMAAWSFFE